MSETCTVYYAKNTRLGEVTFFQSKGLSGCTLND